MTRVSGCVDGNAVTGQERDPHVEECSQCCNRRTFLDEWQNVIKPLSVADYNHHMGHVKKGDRMANFLSISCCPWKWMKKLFFHMLQLAILKSYILLIGI
jgi:hypothetical protein